MEHNLACQDTPWEELIGGEVVLMSPRPTLNHNRVAFNIAYLFERYLKGKRCTVYADGSDLYLSEQDRFVPDVMVVCNPDQLKAKGVFGAPDLVVEVLSPSSVIRDRGKKKAAYETHGVREYWIVDPVSKTIEQYFLKDGELEIAAVHTLLPEDLREEDYTSAFQCSLYDDLILHLEDIFSKMILRRNPRRFPLPFGRRETAGVFIRPNHGPPDVVKICRLWYHKDKSNPEVLPL